MREKLSIGQSIPEAFSQTWNMFVYNINSLKLILRPKTGAYTQVQSPIGIARRLPDNWNWEFIWEFTAMFSIGLAFMNLLPIPGLDGGHALFTIVEMITGRKLSDKAAGYVQTAGMIILLTLMALTFGKDIYQLVVDKLL
uniref:site-2 protease family protein n=1 Tax=Flavobacterium sp. TaxID=239 RepID=UPI004048761C